MQSAILNCEHWNKFVCELNHHCNFKSHLNEFVHSTTSFCMGGKHSHTLARRRSQEWRIFKLQKFDVYSRILRNRRNTYIVCDIELNRVWLWMLRRMHANILQLSASSVWNRRSVFILHSILITDYTVDTHTQSNTDAIIQIVGSLRIRCKV